MGGDEGGGAPSAADGPSADGPEDAPGRDSTPEPSPEEPPAEHADAPEVPDPYQALAEEIRPNAKTLASRVVERLTNYDVGDDLDAVATEAAHGGRASGLRADADAVLHEDAWSRGRVVYPQLGGIQDDETAVMVVVEQTVGLPEGTVLEETRTLDVRLGIEEGAWALEGLASAGGEPVERPDDLPAAAATVLDDERIDLPDTARWDIHRGGVDEELLRLMARLAERTAYGVVVLDTGHPWEIYGTERQSKHTMGKAVDVHRLAPDGPLVIEDRERGSRLHQTLRWLYEQPELSEVGGPWALDGYGGRSFSDPLHQDHLHIGVDERDDAGAEEKAGQG